MPKKRKGGWVQKVVAEMDKGAFSEKAKRAGKTTTQYAQEKASAPGKIGRQARLARTFAKMRKDKKK